MKNLISPRDSRHWFNSRVIIFFLFVDIFYLKSNHFTFSTETEEKELETVSQWYSKNFKLIYTIFFEALNHYNENTVKKKVSIFSKKLSKKKIS